MKQADVSVGTTYVVKVSGHLVPLRLDRESAYGKGWEGTNLATGRQIRIRSAAKLRRVYKPPVPNVVAAAAAYALKTECNNCGGILGHAYTCSAKG